MFAKIFDTEVTQILVTKKHFEDGTYGVEMSIEAQVGLNKEVLTVEASGMDYQAAEQQFESINKESAISMANTFFHKSNGGLLTRTIK